MSKLNHSSVEGGLLNESEISLVKKPLENAALLPPKIYGDDAIYQRECESLLPSSWLPVCHVSQLDETGKYVAKRFPTESVIAIRGKDEKIRVMSNVCRHRNVTLREEGAGKCSGNRIMCPYHGWTYGTDGKLLAAPFMDQTADFDKGNIQLPEFRHEIWHGFVFVNLDGQAKSLSEQLENLEPMVAPYRFEDMIGFEVRRRKVPWNWKVSLENFSEAYHQPWVHSTTAEHHTPASTAVYYDVNAPYPYSVFTMHDKNGERIPSLFAPVSGLNEEFLRRVTVFNIYPYFHVLTDPAMPLWLDFNLTATNEHELVWTIFVPKTVAESEDMEKMIVDVKGFLDPILDEDVEICSSIAVGVKSHHAEQGRMSYMEKAVYQFHNWWLTKLGM